VVVGPTVVVGPIVVVGATVVVVVVVVHNEGKDSISQLISLQVFPSWND